MKRMKKALQMYPDGIVISKGNGLVVETKIIDCCPYYLDCGNDELEESTEVVIDGTISGCRGIDCETCWNKEV